MTTSTKYEYTSERVAATIIDYSVVLIFTTCFFFTFGTPDTTGTYVVHGYEALAPVVFWFIYIVIVEYFAKGTCGHLIFKLRVISMNGRKVTFGQTLARRLCDALEISWCFGLIAFLLVRNTPRNQRLGDFASKTVVTGKINPREKVEFDFEKSITT